MQNLKVLLVDDSEELRLLATQFLKRMGHTAVCAVDGREALTLFAEVRPDIVLLDVMMPGMNGFETATRLKAITGKHWVPIIFLTAYTGDEATAQGIAAGGDDYVTKPLSYVMLKAKIDAISRTLEIQRQLEKTSAALEAYYQRAEEEQRIASHLMAQIVRTDMLSDPLLSHWIQPAENFSGDVIAAARSPGDVLHVMLADGIGHGLAASLNVLPIIDPFYAMTAKGYGVGAIAREMNSKLRRWLPFGHFVAATLIAYDPRGQIIELWNGGNPAPFLVDRQGRMIYEFANRHLPLGIVTDDIFSIRTERLQIDDEVQLVTYSDGLTEAEDSDNQPLMQERLRTILRTSSAADRLRQIKEALLRHLDGRPAHDDIAVALIDCRRTEVAVEASVSADKTGSHHEDGDWSFNTRLTAQELKSFDVVPLLLGLVRQIGSAHDYEGKIFLILSELFNNALDHGLLQLDSTIKNTPDGMGIFLDKRQQRLLELHDASIEISFEHYSHDRHSLLAIRLRDSGPGFDFLPYLTRHPETSTAAHGRGIRLVQGLCANIEYLGCGNEVRVLLQFNDNVATQGG